MGSRPARPHRTDALYRLGPDAASAQGDYILEIETDAGRQTRRLKFRATAAGLGGDWQGVLIAEWEVVAGARGPLPAGGMKSSQQR